MDPSPNTESSRGLLARVGLHRPELRAWALYDWANSAFVLTIQASIFPIYFSDVAAAELPRAVATQRFAWATGIALAVIGLLAPVLGAMADYAGAKKRFLAAFVAVGALATGSLWSVGHGDWLTAAILFGLANIGAQGSFVFYDSLLPHVARTEREMDRASTAGYALGYFGSALLLALQIAWIRWPGAFGLPTGDDLSPDAATLPVRLAFLSVAAWWVLFSIPLFLRVREPERRLEADERPGQNPFRVAFVRLGETFRELRTFRHALLMLLAFIVYNDGIGTIIRMAPVYGREIGIAGGALVMAILMVQVIGVPFAFLFGHLSGYVGPKRSIFLGLAVYVGISVFGYFMETATHFFVLAALVGMVQGGTQALSRSLFASLIPRHKSAEFFGFWGVLDKFAGMLGPLVFATTSALTGSSRYAILSVILFFVVGAALLTRVDVDEGRRVARAADAARAPA